MTRFDSWLLVICLACVGYLAVTHSLHLLWDVPAETFVFLVRAAQGR